jgi:hypothetical protein
MKNIKYTILFFLFLSFNSFAQIIFDFEESISGWQNNIENQQLSTSYEYATSGLKSLKISVDNNETAWISFPDKIDFNGCQFLKFNLYLPDKKLPEISFKCYVKDVEWHWFETDIFRLKGGRTIEVSIDISHTSFKWRPVNHLISWDSYVARDI